MQVVVMLVFLAIVDAAVAKKKLERAKARFQALSALSGTGFTTREAESVVNHPRRRRIATWLIFIGNAGIVAFIILMILYVRAGLSAPSLPGIGIVLGIILVFVVLIKLKVVDRFTDGITRLARQEHAVACWLTSCFARRVTTA